MFDKDKLNRKRKYRVDSFSAHLMSDTKWRELFRVLCLNNSLVKWCFEKSIHDNHLRQFRILPFDEYDFAFNLRGITDYNGGVGGPTLFSEIQQLIFPARREFQPIMRGEKLRLVVETQDINAIKAVIDQVGQIETYMDKDSLIIYGYR